MAERRMIAKTIIDSDLFLDMPMSTQCLYFHLNMRADDDGFINNPKKIQRMVGCNDDDIKLLIAKNFIIPFESGVVVIKHWRIHNYIRMDRYKETLYIKEKAQLEVNEGKEYVLGRPDDIPVVDQMETQVRLGKDRIGKVSKDIEKKEKNTTIDKLIKEYTNNDNLIETLKDFVEMRKAIKKPLTDRALKGILNKLDKLAENEDIKIKILEQSIENCWAGVFELKNIKTSTNSINQKQQFKPTKLHYNAGHESFRNYTPEELERYLREMQKGKGM